jgi:hypothetical protein
MSKMIQLRNVPDHVHRILKRRALEEGTTLSELLVREVTAIATRPTLDDLFERISKRGPVRVRTPTAAAVRAEREARR